MLSVMRSIADVSCDCFMTVRHLHSCLVFVLCVCDACGTQDKCNRFVSNLFAICYRYLGRLSSSRFLGTLLHIISMTHTQYSAAQHQRHAPACI
jgi:hypothetical protein